MKKIYIGLIVLSLSLPAVSFAANYNVYRPTPANQGIIRECAGAANGSANYSPFFFKPDGTSYGTGDTCDHAGDPAGSPILSFYILPNATSTNPENLFTFEANAATMPSGSWHVVYVISTQTNCNNDYNACVNSPDAAGFDTVIVGDAPMNPAQLGISTDQTSNTAVGYIVVLLSKWWPFIIGFLILLGVIAFGKRSIVSLFR